MILAPQIHLLANSIQQLGFAVGIKYYSPVERMRNGTHTGCQLTFQLRLWFSGRTRPCQGRSPGSIPGSRIQKQQQ